MSEIWIKGGIALTMNPQREVIGNSLIKIRDGRIAEIGEMTETNRADSVPKEVAVWDATNMIVMPGMVNAHTHSPMTLLRGTADDLCLMDWLTTKIFPSEQRWGSEVFVEQGTRLAAAEMIRSGTTMFNDMYFFEEKVAKVSSEVGLRSVCGQTILESHSLDKSADDYFAYLDGYLASIKEYSPLVVPSIAPHSVYSVSKESWIQLIEFAESRNVRVHVHVAEVQQEVDDCLHAYGKTPVHFLDELGLWDRCQVIAAHVVCVTESEIKTLGNHRVGISHNIESNLKLGTRIAPVVELRAAGANVAVGTDGAASNNNLDLLCEIDMVAKCQSFQKGPGALNALGALEMLTIDGAAALGMDSEVGSLEVGKSADLIGIDLRQPHLQPMYEPYSHVIYSARGSDVSFSMVAGRPLMKDFKLLTINEEEVLDNAMEWQKKIAKFL